MKINGGNGNKYTKYFKMWWWSVVKFDAQIEFIKKEIMPRIGTVKNLQELSILTFESIAVLYEYKPHQRYYAALILKRPNGKLEVVASKGKFDTKALGLDSPNSFISYALREKKTIYLPNTTIEIPKDQEKELGGGGVEFRYLNEKKSLVFTPSSKTGIDLHPLIEEQNRLPCFIAAPLEFKEEVFGALFVADPMPHAFDLESTPNDVVVFKELADQVAFGIKFLREKNALV